MTYDLQTLLLIEVDTMAVLASLVCGILIWRNRREVPDRSRLILFLITLTALPLISKVFSLMMHGLNNRFVEVLPIVPTLMGLITVGLMLLYAIEVMRPNWFRWRHVLWGYSLLAGVLVLSVLFKDQFTVLHSTNELIQHIGEPNVLLRLLFNLATLLVCLSLLWLPYRWQASSASRRWVITYVCFIFIIGALFHTWTLTLSMPVHIVHNLMPLFFIIYYTWYELHERILPPRILEGQEPVVTPFPTTDTNDLWKRITLQMYQEQAWCNPNLNVETFSKELGTNRIYVARCIMEHTNLSFNDYLNSLRVAHMASLLDVDPLQIHKEAYFMAGFRSRHTAYRNFIKFKGCSPSDYVASKLAK